MNSVCRNWEESFCDRIGVLRKEEVYASRMAAITRSVHTAFAEFQPLLILIVSLGTLYSYTPILLYSYTPILLYSAESINSSLLFCSIL